MQTLREVLAEAERESKAHSDTWPGESRWRTAYEVLGMLKLLDLTILDGVGLVAMDREAGAKAVWVRECHERGALDPSQIEEGWRVMLAATKQRYFDFATDILTACGIIVPDDPDDVVEVVEGEVGIVEIGPPGVSYVTVRRALHPGDTIHIIRQSTLHPPVTKRKEGE